MNPSPEGAAQGWRNAKLEDVADIRSGNGFPIKYQGRTEGEYPFFKVGDISRNWQKGMITLTNGEHCLTQAEVKAIRAKTLPEGSVVFAKIGAAVALNRRAILGVESLVDNNVMALIPSAKTTSRFLFYYMCQVDLGASTRGGAVPSLRRGDVADLEIPLPPLPEQRRIVARIEELFSRLDAGVAALRHAKAQLQRYRQSVLAAAVTGQLTQEWREKHPETESAAETVAAMLRERKEKWERKGKYSTAATPSGDLYPLPEKWCWATWDQLSHWVTYGFTRPMDHVEEGIPIVTAKHVKNSRINYDEGHLTPHKAYDNLSEKDRPQPGDILVTKDGTIGRAAIVESDTPFCINQSVAVVWLRTCPMYRKYLLTTIETESAQRQMTEKARGVAIKHLSITDFARMNVPIPPLAEQQQIVAEVEARTSAIDHLEAELDRQITRSNRLRQSTLASAFNGKLTTH